MADVFLGFDEWLERPAAVKILFPTLSGDADFVRRFQREAKTVARLRHQNIVQIYTTGITEDGYHFLVMEYIPGGSLQEKMNQLVQEGHLLDTATAIGTIYQITEALVVAHQAGIVHRDIKPSNILLREDGMPVLTDLGIAQVQDKPGLTRTNALVGTPTYMSPEQATSSKVDGRSDIYSVGVIMYELFAGKKLFSGETPWAVLHQHITQPPRPITEIRQDLSHTTEAVLLKCLQKEPHHRYQTASELLTALDQALLAENALNLVDSRGVWLGTQPGNTASVLNRETVLMPTPVGLAKAGAPAAASPDTTPTATPSSSSPVARKRPWWLLPLGLLLLLLCGGGALALGPLRSLILPPTPTAERMIAAVVTETTPPTQTATATSPPAGAPTADPVLGTIEALSTLLAGDEAPPTGQPTATKTNTPVHTPTPRPSATPTRTPTATAVATHTPPPTSDTNPVGGSSSGGGLPLGFETFGLWVRGDEANGTFTPSTARSHSGGTSGKLSYTFETDGNDYVVFLQNNSISGSPNALQLWVYGDGDGHFLNAWILDAGGQTWQVPFGRVSHTGWQQMTGYIDTNQSWPWAVISGGSDETVDYPVSFRGFVLDDINNAYTGSGDIYLDDLTAVTLNLNSTPTPVAATPTPGGTPAGEATAPPANPGTVGRILYTSNNILLTTDPDWSAPGEVGTAASDTCTSPATTVSGASYNLYFGPFCNIQSNGTTVCNAPNGQYEVWTDRVEGDVYSIVLHQSGAAEGTFVYQGQIDRNEGIRWSPLSGNFLFVVGDTVHQAFLNGSYNQIISTAFEPRWSPDGSMILYRKPIGPGVNDIFVANGDGSNQRNVTNVTAVDKRCPAWRN